MIPVTSFAGQKRRGLRPRRQRPGDRGARSRPAARPSPPGTTTRRASRGRGGGGHRRSSISRGADWRGFAALVLVARRAAHPSRAALDGGLRAEAAGVEIIGDIELFCRERRRSVARRAVRRHHRHQRQVDHHGADRAYPADGRARRRSSAAISARAVLSLEPPRPGRYHVVECSSFQIDLAPSHRPDGRRPAQPDAGPSRPPRHACERYAAIKERLVAGARDGGRRRRRRLSARRSPTGSSRPASASSASRRGGRSADGVFADGADARRGRRWRDPAVRLARRHRLAARRAQCAERRRGGRGRAGSLGLDPTRRSVAGLASFPGPAAPHGAGRPARPRPLRQRFQGDQRRRRGAGAGELRPHLLDRRRPAEGRRHRQPRRLLPEDRQGLSDRRGGDGVRGDARRRGARSRCRRRSRRRVAAAADDAARDPAAEPVVLLSPACASFDQFKNFEGRGDAFRALVLALDGVQNREEAA